MIKDTFIFYSKWCDAIKDLSPAVRLEIYEAISAYVCTGITPELSAEARAAFGFIRLDIDKDTMRYDNIVNARRQAGSKGGNRNQEQAKQANATKSKQTIASDTNSPPVYDSDSDSISSPTNVVEDEREKENIPPIVPPKEKETTFEEFWNAYHRITSLNKTDREAASKYWHRLSQVEQRRARDNIQPYYNSLNDVKWCKKARTYLSDKNFNDEFTLQTNKLGIAL
ncbi:MAG: DUF6291 domain-containing protein [Alistipes sp.]